LFKMARFDREHASNNQDYFHSVSHHMIVNAFHTINMGENIYNIHLALPGELLHMHQKGMMVRYCEGLEQLIHDRGQDSDVSGRNIGMTILKLNSLALHYGALISHSSDRNLPWTKFKNSLFAGMKKATHEQSGVLLDLLLALLSDCGCQIPQYE
jgi:hypothetical protein